MPLDTARSLRLFAKHLVAQFTDEQRDQLSREPGQVFFPKTVKEIESRKSKVPDGNTTAYIELAEKMLREILSGEQSQAGSSPPHEMLALVIAEIHREVALATKLERQLLHSTGEKA